MEKDFDSWFRRQCLDVQPRPISGARLDTQLQNNFSASYMIHGIPTNGNLPLSSFTAPLQENRPNEPCNWFYSLPRFHPGLKSKDLAGSVQNHGRVGNPENAHRKFLVFDQSGEQTTLLYSSANDTPAQGLPPWLQKPLTAYNSVKDQPGYGINKASPLGRFLGEECTEENHGDAEESEMREDTEELNALLYSDDDHDDGDSSDYSENDEDDEETSTGHSPSTMTAHNKHHRSDEKGEEEVASSDEPTKRQKLFDGSQAKTFGCSELEDDAESSCGNDDGDYRVSGRKRSRKEKIRETISILQKIIPGGKGKDAMDVIDGTIRYLKSLKVEAKSLRLDAL